MLLHFAGKDEDYTRTRLKTEVKREKHEKNVARIEKETCVDDGSVPFPSLPLDK